MDPTILIEKLVWYILLVFVITVHEWAHAWTADKCGDPTARLMGRMTWNPLPHMDIFGTVLIPLMMIFIPLGGVALLGWGKPVPVNPRNFRRYSLDDVLVSLSGPFSNIIMTLVALLLIRIAIMSGTAFGELAITAILEPMAQLAFILAFFNLIPIPPLDGSHLVRSMLGYQGRQMFDRISRYGFIILLVLINTRVLFPVFAAVQFLYMYLLHLIAGV
jgi:Zn-dependent protease